MTGAAGAFDLGAQPVTGYTLAAVADGRTETVRSFDLDDPTLAADGLEVALQPCTTVVHGVVKSTEGTAIPGARIAPALAAGLGVVTGADGRYQLCMSRDVASFRVSADGFARQLAPLRAGWKKLAPGCLDPRWRRP